MKFSKQTREFAYREIVSIYANYYPEHKQFNILFDSVPMVDLFPLASMMMNEDYELANEATSCDNPHYKDKMLPAMLKFMTTAGACFNDDTYENDNPDFVSSWFEGIINYLRPHIEELLNEEVQNFNFHRGEIE